MKSLMSVNAHLTGEVGVRYTLRKAKDHEYFILTIGDGTYGDITIFLSREQALSLEFAISSGIQDADTTTAESELAEAAAELAEQESTVNYDNISEPIPGGYVCPVCREINCTCSGVDMSLEPSDYSNGLPMTRDDFRCSE